jgi:hypothetical protein
LESLIPLKEATVTNVAMKQDVIPATQYAIGPSLFPLPPRNEGESISITCFRFSYAHILHRRIDKLSYMCDCTGEFKEWRIMRSL